MVTLDEEFQAVLLHSRDRRRSLAGIVDLFKTHRFALPDAVISTSDVFPSRAKVITLSTTIRITSAVSTTGLIFEFGGTNRGMAAWLDVDQISFRAGGAGANVRALGTFTTGTGALPDTMILHLIFAVRPATGRIRVWANGDEIIRETNVGNLVSDGSFVVNDRYTIAFVGSTDFTAIGASSNTVGVEFQATGVGGAGSGNANKIGLPGNEFAGSGDGSFASAFSGDIPADVTQTGAPVGFEVIERLSVYLDSVPRHFL